MIKRTSFSKEPVIRLIIILANRNSTSVWNCFKKLASHLQICKSRESEKKIIFRQNLEKQKPWLKIKWKQQNKSQQTEGYSDRRNIPLSFHWIEE